MSRELAEKISNDLKPIIGEWEQELSRLGIVVVKGVLEGGGHTLIKVSDWKEELKKFPTSEVKLAVFEIEYFGDDDDDDDDEGSNEAQLIESLNLSIKVGEGNIWLSCGAANVFADLYDDDEGFGSESYGNNEEEQAAINSTALLVAKEKVFGSFRNKDQREDFVVAFVKKHKIANLPHNY
jgi:hypothetical protein